MSQKCAFRSKSPCSKSRQQNVHLYMNIDVSDTEVWSKHCLESMEMWDSSVLFLFARTFKKGHLCFTKHSLCCHILKFNLDGLGTDDPYQVNTQAQMQTSRNCEMINHETDVFSQCLMWWYHRVQPSGWWWWSGSWVCGLHVPEHWCSLIG